MKKISKSIIVILFILSYANVFSQTKFLSGYMVASNGDTIHGYIRPDVEGELFNRFFFSNSESGASPKEYTKTEAQAFGFNGENKFQLLTFKDVDDKPASNYAKLVLRGYYNLYSFQRKDADLYILQHDSTYLLYDDVRNANGILVLDTRGNYQNQLSFLSRNCESLNQTLLTLNYNLKSIIQFTENLNKCVSPETKNEFVYVKPKQYSRIGAYVGGLILNDKYDYTARVFNRFYAPSISKKTSLNISVVYLARKTSTTKVISYFITNKYEHIINSISLGGTLQYRFALGAIQPYLEGGFGFAYKREKDELYKPQNGFQSDFGVDVIGAIGVEGYITKNLVIKADWRYELLTHYPMIGIAYFFSK